MINKENYRNLMDSELQRYFKEYFNKTGKTANYGLHITKEFKNFLENHEKIPNKIKKELLDKTAKINENREIEKLIIYQIRTSNLSQGKIIKTLKEMGLATSKGTITRISLEKVYNGNLEKYKGRFTAPKDKIPKEIKECIIVDIKSNNSGPQKDLARKHGVSISFIRSIAKKILPPEEYKKQYPAPEKIPEEIRENIISDIKSDNSGSQKGIARKHGVSDTLVRKIAKEILTPEEYKKQFPVHEKIPEEIRENIIADIKSDKSGSQGEIARKYGVSPGSIRRIAQEILSPEEYMKQYPASEKILEEIRENIIADIKSDNSGSRRDLARKYDVDPHTIGEIAQEILPLEEYKKRFLALKDKIPKEIKECIIADIKSDNSGSRRDLARKHGVSDTLVGNIAKEILTPEEYKKKFPAYEKISEEIRENIISDIKSDNPGSQRDLAIKYGVSRGSIGSMAKEILTPEELKEKFPSDIPAEIGTITHVCINDLITKDFDERRKNAPNVPKIYCEPRIYQPLSEKHADIGFLNDTKYLQELLTNSIHGNSLNRELEIDPNKLDYIKFVQFDYTNLLDEENIMNKIEKYQHPEIMNFIVGLKWDRRWEGRTKKPPFGERIKYPENIKIINDECFTDLMQIKGINKEKFKEIIDLNKRGDLYSLKEIYEKESQDLHNLDELKKDLREKGLIKRDISEYINNIENNKQSEGTLDQFIYNENRNKEQKEDKEFEDVLDDIKEQKEDKEFEGVLDEINEKKEEVKREDVSDDNIEDAVEDESDNESDNYYENY